MPVCPNCGNQAAENAVFCDQCGTRLPTLAEPPAATAVAAEPQSAGGVPEGVLICPSCGAENVPGEVFCDVCGEPLEAPEPVASEVVAAAEAAPEVPVEVEVELETVLEPEVEEVPVEAAEPAVGEATYCPVCGASVSPGDTFCGTCGASLTEAAEEATVAEEPVFTEAELEEAPPEEMVAEPVIVEEEPVAEEPAVAETEVGGAVLVEEEPAEEMVAEPVVVEAEPAEELIAEPVIVEEEAVAETVIVEPEAAAEATAVEAAAAPEAEPTQAAPAPGKCPVCGANVVPGQRFCASCGAALPAAEEAVPAPAPAPSVGPYLEVVDSGAHIPLVDQPELLIGRTDDISGIYPDVDLTPHGGEEGGVSRRHAHLIHTGDNWYVVDLDSTNGTYVNGTEVTAEVQVPIQDGDRLSFGDAQLVFRAS